MSRAVAVESCGRIQREIWPQANHITPQTGTKRGAVKHLHVSSPPLSPSITWGQHSKLQVSPPYTRSLVTPTQPYLSSLFMSSITRGQTQGNWFLNMVGENIVPVNTSKRLQCPPPNPSTPFIFHIGGCFSHNTPVS